MILATRFNLLLKEVEKTCIFFGLTTSSYNVIS